MPSQPRAPREKNDLRPRPTTRRSPPRRGTQPCTHAPPPPPGRCPARLCRGPAAAAPPAPASRLPPLLSRRPLGGSTGRGSGEARRRRAAEEGEVCPARRGSDISSAGAEERCSGRERAVAGGKRRQGRQLAVVSKPLLLIRSEPCGGKSKSSVCFSRKCLRTLLAGVHRSWHQAAFCFGNKELSLSKSSGVTICHLVISGWFGRGSESSMLPRVLRPTESPVALSGKCHGLHPAWWHIVSHWPRSDWLASVEHHKSTTADPRPTGAQEVFAWAGCMLGSIKRKRMPKRLREITVPLYLLLLGRTWHTVVIVEAPQLQKDKEKVIQQ